MPSTTLKRNYLLILFFLVSLFSFSQTKVNGAITDISGEPIPFCNVLFSGSIEGTTSDENGKFSLESTKTWNELQFSFIGYKTLTVPLTKKTNFNLKVVLKEEAESLKEVVIVTGKQPKKNNPAIDILREIWRRKKQNGLKKFDQYQYNKYEKIQIDLNTIDEKFKKNILFKGVEFIFDNVDSSGTSDKKFLPVFLNESYFEVYGDNILNKKKEDLVANQNSGFKGNQQLITFVEDFHSDYDIYDNHITFFDKSFSSPLSRTGINNYNYYLSDSAFIDNKWCYNIIYYPRRKSELTFKGDFWVNDTTFAVKKINLRVSKNSNINWVRDIYIEQEFDILNDSIFVLKRDYFLSDFSINERREKSKGVYVKKTTVFDDYIFNKPLKDKKIYSDKSFLADDAIFEKDEEFWAKHRLEELNENEQKIYKLYDTLQKTKKFKLVKKIGSTIGTRFIPAPKLGIDIGDLFETIGSNDVEGFRLQSGFRTYKSYNDLFRFQAYGAYGFRDKEFKYGYQAKWLIEPKNRITVFAGNRQDIEQNGASLTGSVDVLGRNQGSSAVINTGINDKLTSVNLTSLGFSLEPIPNLPISLTNNFKTLSSASETFSLDYIDPDSPTGISSEIRQFETSLSIGYYPKRKKTGYGVERDDANTGFTQYFVKVTQGTSGILDSDFDYTKIQFSYNKLFRIGSLGRLRSSIEFGQTFGEVPLALLDIAPGNQSFFILENSFNLLDFYEFVTDRYAAIHLEHNFNGRIISRIPLLNKTKLRTFVGFKSFIGSLSDRNREISTTGNPVETPLVAPDIEPYYEYSVGLRNIFKFFGVNFNFRGNYLDNTPDVRRFGTTVTFGFVF